MECPICKNEPMITLELSNVEIDYCLKCKGIWLDAGELEMLLGNDKQTTEFLQSFNLEKNPREKKVKCPICTKKMEKISVGTEAAVQIDRCKNGDGIWFDKGELEEVIKHGSLGKDNQVLDLLQE
ncbi:MAG: zf-TFIIB domain-containing protein, partial [Candidatus Cloacimonetes bacterium]|nr:zf-TFIIB domain-containing protein [Candidatus Cloacimonadota bacterium]